MLVPGSSERFSRHNHGVFFAEFASDFAACSSVVEYVWRFDFGDVDAKRVLVKFGASGLTSDRAHFGDREDDFLGFTSYAVALVERYARQRGNVDSERTLVERRQERASQREKQRDAHSKEDSDADEQCPDVPQTELDCPRIDAAQTACDPGFATLGGILGACTQKVITEYRSQRESYYCRGYQGYDKRYAQRDEHTAFDAAEEEKRQETGDDYQRGIEDGHAYLGRCVVNDLKYRFAFGLGLRAVFAQALVDVFDIDYGIVDKRAYGNGDAAQRHGVERVAKCMQDNDCKNDGQGQSDNGDDRRAQVHQEEEQNDDDKERAFEQGLLKI